MVKRVVALILSLIYCGLGQIFNRQIIKGIDFIVIYTVLLSSYRWPWPALRILGISLVPLMWFIGMVDAYLGEDAIFRRKQRFLGILPGILITIALFYIQVAGPPLNIGPMKSRLDEFSIQIAASKDIDQARKLSDELSLKGYSVRIGESESGGGELFRVLVGNFRTAKEARLYAEQMDMQEGLLGSMIYNVTTGETIP